MPKSKQRASHIRRMLRPAGAPGPRRWDTLAEPPAGARFRRSKLAWLGVGLALLLGLYALLGFQLVPRILQP